MRKLLPLLIALLIFFPSCVASKPEPPTPSPTPEPDLARIPEWVKEPEDIEVWCRVSGADYVSDKVSSGYNHYVFTPAEMLMTEIPDTVNLPKTIRKRPWIGDCDDWAVFTAWAMDRLGLEAHYVEIYTSGAGHAISYGIDAEGKCHVFDLWFYKGSRHKDIYAYVEQSYPGWRVTKDMPIWNFLNILFLRGHVKYLPTEEDTRQNRHKSAGGYCTIGGTCE